MPIPQTTEPKEGDTLTISLMKLGMILGVNLSHGDNAHRIARRIGGQLSASGVGLPEAPADGRLYARQNRNWTAIQSLVGPWQDVPVAPGYTGGLSTIQARWLLDPQSGVVQMRGMITGGADWSGTAPQIVAILPLTLRPSNTRYLNVLSGDNSSYANSLSVCAITVSGQVAMYSIAGFTYSVIPNRALFDSAIYPIN